MENKAKKRISQLRKSIELQERIKSNLGSMIIADAGKTVELCDLILATLRAQLAIYCGECGDKVSEISDMGLHSASHNYMRGVAA